MLFSSGNTFWGWWVKRGGKINPQNQACKAFATMMLTTP
jgi:hypothetical protein